MNVGVKHDTDIKVDENARNELPNQKSSILSRKVHNTSRLSHLLRRYQDIRNQGVDVINDRMLRAEQILGQLKELGLSRIALMRWEPSHLYGYLHPYERVLGVVYGKTETGGRALLAATNTRILYVDRDGFLTTIDEVPFSMVSGVSLTRTGLWGAVVTLHTRTKDYSLGCYRMLPAEIFVNYIEATSIRNENLINLGHQMSRFGQLRANRR